MESPLIGVGMGNWEMKRFTTDPLHSAAVPHNSFLLALAEGGVIGLGLYLALFIQTIRGLMRIEKQPQAAARARGDGVYWLVTATRVCLICFMLFSMFSDLWELIFFYFLFGLGGALIHVYGEPTRAVAHA
jgi:O-antigen ligase